MASSDVEDVSNCVSSDEERPEVDPFHHRIRMTKFQWLRTIVLGMVLVPIRLLMILILMLIAWIVASVTLVGLTDDEILNKPMRNGWRRNTQWLALKLGKACVLAAGFRVTVKGTQADPQEAPVLVAAPHSTFFDAFVVFWTKMPYIVSRQENRKLPIFGKCIDMVQSISVTREDKDSKQRAVKEIIRRTNLTKADDPGERWGQLLLFPEGSTGNRKALMSFKPGAFYPGKPVQPVVVRYNNPVDTVTWTWNQPHGSKTTLLTTLAQLITYVEMEFLPVYYPSEDEEKDAKLYAMNVREVMADKLSVPTCNLTFEEVKARYAGLYRKKVKSKDA